MPPGQALDVALGLEKAERANAEFEEAQGLALARRG
jgi:hypothetical protein